MVVVLRGASHSVGEGDLLDTLDFCFFNAVPHIHQSGFPSQRGVKESLDAG